jgi:hypothetical protein
LVVESEGQGDATYYRDSGKLMEEPVVTESGESVDRELGAGLRTVVPNR